MNTNFMQELNPDGTIKTKPVEWETTSATFTATSTWTACSHENGTYFTVKFWIFRKRLFFCEDCHRPFKAKFIKQLKKMYAKSKT